MSGTFTLYVSNYDTLPIPTPDTVGKPLTKLGRGPSVLTMAGSFTAGLR